VYSLQVAEEVLKRLKRLPPKHKRQVWERIKALQGDPRPHDHRRLKGIDGYRITVGEYRALYTIDDQALVVRVYLLIQRGEGYPR
jgi:mRNA interferase RelE/StbE